MFRGHLDYFQKPPLGGRLNTKPGDHGTLNAHDCWFILFRDVWGPAWIKFHWNSIWLRAWSHMTSHYTGGSVTTLHDFGGVLRWPLDTFLLGSHNFMVTALGSCVKWWLVISNSSKFHVVVIFRFSFTNLRYKFHTILGNGLVIFPKVLNFKPGCFSNSIGSLMSAMFLSN